MTNARVQGYRDYYDGIYYCPYSHETEHELWSDWCDGQMEAECEDEGK